MGRFVWFNAFKLPTPHQVYFRPGKARSGWSACICDVTLIDHCFGHHTLSKLTPEGLHINRGPALPTQHSQRVTSTYNNISVYLAAVLMEGG